PHKCSACGKDFVYTASLKSHMKTHTGEKPYKCPVCERDFRHSTTLKNHVKTHVGEGTCAIGERE
ncbi:unnamed protein product, partial [Lampetra fluviatilis]